MSGDTVDRGRQHQRVYGIYMVYEMNTFFLLELAVGLQVAKMSTTSRCPSHGVKAVFFLRRVMYTNLISLSTLGVLFDSVDGVDGMYSDDIVKNDVKGAAFRFLDEKGP